RRSGCQCKNHNTCRNAGARLLTTVIWNTLIEGQLVQTGPLAEKTFHIKEGSPATLIYQFQRSNARSAKFALDGEKDGLIDILPDDGWLRTIGTLDWEKRPVHKLQVKTVDSGGSVVEGPYAVTIIVDDINNNVPAFNQSQYNAEVRELSRPGIAFITVYATDKDDPSTPNAKLVYHIMQQIPDPKKVLFFQINNMTGEISTTINGSLNMKAGDKFDLLLSVSDSAEKPFTNNAKVTILVTENLWKKPNPVTIVENSTAPHPMKITQVRWNDDSVIYELHQRDKFERFPFSIDQNGDINVTEPLDREEHDQYIFYALVKNHNGISVALPLTIEVIVEDINDNPPVCPAAETPFEIQEIESIGSQIGDLKATDKDLGSNALLTYTLLTQWPTIPTDGMFLVNQYSGSIQLIGPGLNIQDNNEYRLRVNVADGGEPSLSTICFVTIRVIDINDNIPMFDTSDYGSIALREDTPLNTLVREIQATDADQANTGSSMIIYQITHGDPGHMFTIETDPKTNRGSVRVASPLDYEEYKHHYLVIQARNPEPLVTGISYNDSSVTRLLVNVTDVDERPVFSSSTYQAQFREDIPIGTKIISIVASDPEGDQIRFSLKGNSRNWLRIDEITGDIYTNLQVDREIQNHYQVEVIARELNNPQMSSSVYFTLFLDDVNDNAPRLAKDYFDDFSYCYPLTKPESFEFQATDDDYHPGGLALKFQLGGDANITNDWEIIYINGSSARLCMKHSQFPKANINVPVIIRDNGRPPMEATVYILVRICSCTAKNVCETEPPGNQGKPSVGMALGILFGTLAVIGIIIAAVFISINKKKKNVNKTPAGDALNATETVNLGL
ncbi:cadherin-17, partial [Pseudophryne corroboree]|uniref:cadherin-17 n=1 Tax=Pseudophryne corroboree TaxID=495146 RepID=UPI003081D5CB